MMFWTVIAVLVLVGVLTLVNKAHRRKSFVAAVERMAPLDTKATLYPQTEAYPLTGIEKHRAEKSVVESDESYEASAALMQKPKLGVYDPIGRTSQPDAFMPPKEPAPASESTAMGAALVKAMKEPAKPKRKAAKKAVAKKK